MKRADRFSLKSIVLVTALLAGYTSALAQTSWVIRGEAGAWNGACGTPSMYINGTPTSYTTNSQGAMVILWNGPKPTEVRFDFSSPTHSAIWIPNYDVGTNCANEQGWSWSFYDPITFDNYTCPSGVDMYISPRDFTGGSFCGFPVHLRSSCTTTSYTNIYQWQITNNPGVESSWVNLGGLAGDYRYINESDLPSFGGEKYGTRSIRIKDGGTVVGYTTVTFQVAGPQITIMEDNDPSCHNKEDGNVKINITPHPLITNFVVSMVNATTNLGHDQEPDLHISQFPKNFLNVGAGIYYTEVKNNTNKQKYGECQTVINNIIIDQPAEVKIAGFLSDPAKCKGGNTGKITITSTTGGSGTGYTYTKDETPITGNQAPGLTAGSYTFQATDSKGCLSPEISIPVEEPLNNITASLSAKDYRGYETKCWDTSDGEITATVTHNVGTITYEWYKGAAKINGQTAQIISGQEPATYHVVVKDGNACTATSANITLDPPPQINFTIDPSGTINCPGDKTITLGSSIVQTSIVGTPTYEWSPASISEKDDPSLFNKGAGTYSLKVSDNQGCNRTKQTTIADPDPYSVSITTEKSITCKDSTNGKLKAIVLDGNGLAASANSYQWYRNGSSYSSGASIDELNEATYKVVVTYNGSCTAEDDLLLEDPSAVIPVIDITSTTVHYGEHISCPGKNDGSLHATATKGTPGTSPNPAYTFSWHTDPIVTGPDLTGLAAGTYTVTAKDGNQCPGTASITLKDPQPVKAAIAIDKTYNGFPVKCHDSADGIITASATGGTNVYTYQWDFPAAPPQATTAQLSGIPGGTYTVIVKDQNLCPDTLSITLNNPQPVETSISILSLADFKGQAISCHDKADARLGATANGGTNSFTYSWNTIPATSGNLLSGVPAGTYIVTATDINGCSANETVTLDNPTPVIASITGFSDYNGYGVKCLGSDEGFIEASGSGGTGDFTYEWPGSPETSFRNADLTAGIYSVIVRDGNGCPDIVSHEITEPSQVALFLDAFEDVSCFDGATGKLTMSGSGGVGGFEYSLNDIDWQASPEFSDLRALTHTVSIRDLNGCSETLAKTLSQPEEIVIDVATEPAFCADPRGAATATVTGGVGNYNYEWKDAAANIIGALNVIENQKAGTYTLLVTDGNSCPMVANVGITSTDGAIVNSKEIIGAKCSYSADGSGLLEVTDGDGPFTFLWPDGQTSIQGNNLAKGNYIVTVTDVNDCVVVHPVEIPAPEPLEVNLVESTVPTCNGNCDGKIKVLAEGGTGSYIYTWASQTNEEAQNLCAGTHAVTVTDINSCTLQETFTLLQPEPLKLKLEKRTLPLCFGGCDGEIEVSSSGGNGGYLYNWANGNSGALTSGICAGDHTVTVTDSKNCRLEGTYQLGEPTLLQVHQIRKQNPICYDGCNGQLEVQAFGGTGTYSYSWNNGVNTPALLNLCAADYTVNILDANACAVSQTYSIENPPKLVIDLGGSVTLCTGQTHVLDAGETWATYNWRSNTNFAATTSKVLIQDAGQYWLEVINSDGCTAQDTFLLETSADLLKASFLIPKEALVNDTIAIIDISWPLPETTTWSLPTTMRKVMDLGDIIYGQFSEPGIYEVGLQTFLGQCTDEIGKTILILEGEAHAEGGRLGHEEYVKEFTLFPNPTDGDFEVTAEFIEAGPATLSVWNTPTGYLIKKVQASGKSKYHFHFDLRPLSTGTYVLRLDHANGKRYIRFIVK